MYLQFCIFLFLLLNFKFFPQSLIYFLYRWCILPPLEIKGLIRFSPYLPKNPKNVLVCLCVCSDCQAFEAIFFFWVSNTHESVIIGSSKIVGIKGQIGEQAGLNMRMTERTKIAQIRRRWEFIYEFAEVETHIEFAMSWLIVYKDLGTVRIRWQFRKILTCKYVYFIL